MHCYFCHGYSGDAKTEASGYLNPKPRDFSRADPALLSRKKMQQTVNSGKPGTAMMGFSDKLSELEISAVIEFIRDSFMLGKIENTRYHIESNGWYAFSQHKKAFAFVSGDLAIDSDNLNAQQQRGLRLFLSTCLTCHEGRSDDQTDLQLDVRAVSFPRSGYSHKSAGTDDVDTLSGATPFARHDRIPQRGQLSVLEQQGEQLFQNNCAFCHAPDGTGKNWIGRFLQPHPRDLTDDRLRKKMTAKHLGEVINNGLVGTTMPAWKSVLNAGQIDALVAYVLRVFIQPQES